MVVVIDVVVVVDVVVVDVVVVVVVDVVDVVGGSVDVASLEGPDSAPPRMI